MADPRFFDLAGPFSLKQLCDLAQAELANPDSADVQVSDVAPIEQAGDGQITFLDNPKYKESLKSTKALACILHPKMQELAPEGVHLLLSKNPYKSYALVAQAFYPAHLPRGEVSEHAVVHDGAKVHESASVEACAVIHDGADIGEGSLICAGAVIGRNVKIGKGTKVGANSVISHAHIGDGCNIYPGVCIGQDGFGFAIDPAGHVKVPQLGRVIVGDHVEIGSGTTIDRGAGPDTVIGSGTWIDNQVQIAHNVKTGMGCVIVAQAGIAGSTELGDFVVVAAKAGVAGHLKIGMGAQIGAMSGVMNDLEPGARVVGQPAQPSKEYMRQIATLKKLAREKKSA